MKPELLPSARQTLSISPHFWPASAVVWTACVLGMALSPMKDIDWYTATINDKTVHGFAFAVGAVVWALTLRGLRLNIAIPIIFGGMISLALGGLIELLQKFVPGRSAESGDFYADILGVLFAVGLLLLISHRNQKNTDR